MTNEQKVNSIKSRIARLVANGKDNGAIVKKLQRQVRALEVK